MSDEMYLTDLPTMREAMFEGMPAYLLTPEQRKERQERRAREEKKSYGENLAEALNESSKGILTESDGQNHD